MSRLNFEISHAGHWCCFVESDDGSNARLVSRVLDGHVWDEKVYEFRQEEGVCSYLVPVAEHSILCALATGVGVFDIVIVDVALGMTSKIGTVTGRKLRIHRPVFPSEEFVVLALQGDGGVEVHGGRLDTSTLSSRGCVPHGQLIGGGFSRDGRVVVNRMSESGKHLAPVEVASAVLDGLGQESEFGEFDQLNRPVKVSLCRDAGYVGIFQQGDPLSYGVVRGHNVVEASLLSESQLESGASYRVIAATRDLGHVLLHADSGSCASFFLWSPGDGSVVPVKTPPCVLSGASALVEEPGSGDVARVCVSTPFVDMEMGVVLSDDGKTRSGILRLDVPWAPHDSYEVERSWVSAGAEEREVFEWSPTGSPKSLVFSLHGGPYDAWFPRYHWLHASLASSGVLVVAPNLAGSSSCAPDDGDEPMTWGVTDAVELVEVIAEYRRRFPSLPVVLHGESYGAYLALVMFGRDESIDRVVAVSPFSGPSSLYRRAGEGVKQMMVRRGGWSLRDGWTSASPELSVDTAWRRGPALLVRGIEDPVIPRDEFDALVGSSDNGSRLTILEERRGGHRPDSLSANEELRSMILDFVLRAPR